jgi:peptidoglycan/LPS O-acetylase OafA/YrhL
MVLERIHMAVWPATVVLVVLLLLARNDARVTYSALLTLASAAVAILLLGVTRSQSGLRMWVLENATLGWIGRISYGLYLWHDPIFFHMLSESRMTRVGIIGPMVLVVRFALTFGIAAVSYYLIERPCLRLKNRLAGAA